MQPFISVAICTRDRARHLTAALDALRPAVERCRGRVDVEVLVVDNGSSDATAAVAAANANTLPMRCVVEPTPGLSHARNRACREARGDYIAWIDDDVVVDADWLLAYADAIQRHPDAAFFGGPIRLRFEGLPPGWLTDASLEIEHIYSALDLGGQARRIERRRDLPYGANYVVRQREQRLVSYDTQLGRQPGSPWLAGEESVALGALLDSGARGWWVPEAGVEHVIPRRRQTLRYLLAHGYGMGRTDARRKPVAAGAPLLLGRPRWLWARLARSILHAIRAGLGASARTWVPALHTAANVAGRVRDYDRGDAPEASTSESGLTNPRKR